MEPWDMTLHIRYRMLEAEPHSASLGIRGETLLFGRDSICAVVAEPSAARMLHALKRALKGSKTVEIRLDWLENQTKSENIIGHLKRLSLRKKRACLIATLRRREGGGRFTGSVAEQMALLENAARAGCRWCDLELESAARVDRQAIQALRKTRARVMISFHDFRGTPANIEGVTRRLASFGGDAIKIAALANSLGDATRLLAVARRRRNLVAVPMGEIGLPGRILALREGSSLAYAAVSDSTAPGQLSVEEMRDLYRADRLDRRTRIYGVIGDPIGHSLSPQMHNAAFVARRVNAVLLPFQVRDLKDFIGAREDLGMSGFAVTLPHKQRILRYLDGCDPLAAQIGAVNTVVVRGGGKLYGYNTDYVGVLRAVERRVRLAGSRVLLLGAGGAARAAAFALREAGAIVNICARRPRMAKALARAAGAEVIARPRLRGEFFDAVINATPVGMKKSDGSPLRASELNCRVVMDMIYRPMETPLLRMARRRGIETVSGVEMFLAQGAAQWEIWMGERAPEKIMRRTVLAALQHEGSGKK
ncbi:MAG TPA: shikimate dehydrogenase [Candidatus Acidoferrum sp.]|nr:shikimate dehydrogenase [Candidatus Acidoferrum sp.]